ncbi:MAG TPA: hypothetical protein VIC08_16715, partial [Cellvibrionaceae bacterium]
MNFVRRPLIVLAFFCAGFAPLAATEEISESGFKGDREGHEMRDVIPKRDIPPAPVLSVEQALKRFQ